MCQRCFSVFSISCVCLNCWQKRCALYAWYHRCHQFECHSNLISHFGGKSHIYKNTSPRSMVFGTFNSDSLMCTMADSSRFFFDAIQTTNSDHDNETQSPPSYFPAPSITSFLFALRNAQIVRSSATNNGRFSSSPEWARLESPFCLSQSGVLLWEHLQDVFAGNLRELQAHFCLVDHKYVVRRTHF